MRQLVPAMCTPLASIFRSGFLVIVPVLASSTGPYAVWAMPAAGNQRTKFLLALLLTGFGVHDTRLCLNAGRLVLLELQQRSGWGMLTIVRGRYPDRGAGL